MQQVLAFLAASVAVSLGTAGVVYGEVGDTPELMLLGLLLVVGALALGGRNALRASSDGGSRSRAGA